MPCLIPWRHKWGMCSSVETAYHFFSLFNLQSFNPECFHDCVSLLFQKDLTSLLKTEWLKFSYPWKETYISSKTGASTEIILSPNLPKALVNCFSCYERNKKCLFLDYHALYSPAQEIRRMGNEFSVHLLVLRIRFL